MPASGSPHVVTTEDFTDAEFLALDWTNLSPECIASSTLPEGGAAPCPLPYDPAAPLQGAYKTSGTSFFPQ